MASSPTGPAARREALRHHLRVAGLDSLLVTDLVNIRYLTGFTGSNAAALVSAHDSPADEHGTLLCIDGRYDTQSAAEVPDLERVIDRPCDVALLRRATGRVGFESHVVTVAGYAGLQRTATERGVALLATEELVEAGRAVKDPGEIDTLALACDLADRAFAELIATGGIRPGRTEREVGLDLDRRMLLLGAEAASFDTIVAAGERSAIPHHRPSAAELRTGDLVTFDFGAEADGYHSDMTRTVVLGPPADWQRDLHALVAAAQQAGRDAVRVGVDGDAIDTAARRVVVEGGHGDHFTHGLGHGVGLRIHEAPALGVGSAAIMSLDMCVTVEPGVYLPGRGGVRIEDTGVVRPDAFSVLTHTTKELLEL